MQYYISKYVKFYPKTAIAKIKIWYIKPVENFDFTIYMYLVFMDNSSTYSELLWVAPELLRLVCFPPKGTQKGDIYAFAIILQEIILRATPYENETLEPNGELWSLSLYKNVLT